MTEQSKDHGSSRDLAHAAGGVREPAEAVVYAVGDIHGRLDLLTLAADAIMDDLAGRAGRVIFLGDYVDRGPDSQGVVEFLMTAQRDGAVTCLKGNHEQIMVDAIRHGRWDMWMHNGGDATWASYAENVPAEHLDWMDALPTVAEVAGRIFVHAGLMPGVPLAAQEPEACIWIRDRFLTAEKDFEGWPHIVHGHTPRHPLKPALDQPELLSWRTNLDTAAFHTGVLTVGVFEGEGGAPSRIISVTLNAATASPARQTVTDPGKTNETGAA